MPQCQKCQVKFSIAPEDQELLKKLDLPDPAFCFHHWLQEKTCFRNERNLYRSKCLMCKKSILSMYSPNSWAQVYCRDCWWSDRWNALELGRKYDPQRSFFDQWAELIQSTPHFNLFKLGQNENSEYTNIIEAAKDSYLTFSSLAPEACIYCKHIGWSRDCIDCYSAIKSELLYDCMDTYESYRCAWLTRAHKCTDCYLGRDLADCQDCFGCVNLKHKRFSWFNQPLSGAEYRRRLQVALKDRESFTEHQKQFEKFQQSQPVKFAALTACEDCAGEGLVRCKNIRNGFQMEDSENGGDIRIAYNIKDDYRLEHSDDTHNSYDVTSVFKSSNVLCSYNCERITFSAYCVMCYNSEDLLGCSGLRFQKYCILNTSYTQKEYHALKEKIIRDMKERGEWGKFLSAKFSPFGYNDTPAQEVYPLTQEAALQGGFRWETTEKGVYGQHTLSPRAVPAAIDHVQASITQEVLECTKCGINYRIVGKEFEVLKKLHLPLPLTCQNCRYTQRLSRYFFPQVYKRTCQCGRQEHSEHRGSHCSKTFETPYNTQRPESVFCATCYNAVVS